MKRFNRFLLLTFLILLVYIMIPQSGFAQVGDPNCDPSDPGCPIDGGLSALLAIGVGYGIKKIRDSRKA